MLKSLQHIRARLAKLQRVTRTMAVAEFETEQDLQTVLDTADVLAARVKELEQQLKKEQRLDECAEKLVGVMEDHLKRMPRAELVRLVWKHMRRATNESLEIQALERDLATSEQRVKELENIVENLKGDLASVNPFIRSLEKTIDNYKTDYEALADQVNEAGQQHATDAVKLEATCTALREACEAGLEALRYIVHFRRSMPVVLTLTAENDFVKLDDHMNQLERTFVQKAQAALATGLVEDKPKEKT